MHLHRLLRSFLSRTPCGTLLQDVSCAPCVVTTCVARRSFAHAGDRDDLKVARGSDADAAAEGASATASRDGRRSGGVLRVSEPEKLWRRRAERSYRRHLLWRFFEEEYHFKDVDKFGEAEKKQPRIVDVPLGAIRTAFELFKDHGFTDSDLEAFTHKTPMLWTYSAKNLLHKLQYYRSLGIGAAELVDMIRTLPKVLCYSPEANVKKKVKYLQDLGLSKEDIRGVLIKFPSLLNLSLGESGKIKRVVKYFQSENVTKQEIAFLIKRAPSVMGLSLEGSIMPKYRLAREILGKSPEEILACPVFFSLSLYNRIMFRVVFLKMNHFDVYEPTLRTIFVRSAKEFSEVYGLKSVLDFEVKWNEMEEGEKEDLVELCRRF